MSDGNAFSASEHPIPPVRVEGEFFTFDDQAAYWARLRPYAVLEVAEAVVALLVQRGYVRAP